MCSANKFQINNLKSHLYISISQECIFIKSDNKEYKSMPQLDLIVHVILDTFIHQNRSLFHHCMHTTKTDWRN